MPRTRTLTGPSTGGRPKGLPKTGGRSKGTSNKATAAIKEAMLQVFAEMQARTGEENGHFLDWALRNSTEFYKLTARLLPHQVTGEEGGPVITRIELVAPTAEEIERARGGQ